MRARDVVGKRIAAVRQEYSDTNGGRKYCLVEIVLDDGTRLRPLVHERPEGDGYDVSLLVVKRKHAAASKEVSTE